MASNRTIQSVLNIQTGEEIVANDFFKLPESDIWKYRIRLQEAILGKKESLFVCYICGQNVQINGGIGTNSILHFKHFKDSPDCPLKTNSKLNKSDLLRAKYNGAKESPEHYNTKHLIQSFLLENELNKREVQNIVVEKRIKGRLDLLKWKKPDVSCEFLDRKLVFEIQLSTTFLSVIVDREHFYRENETYIIWVFRRFEIDKFKQRFTDKDIFYSNNRNAFVLDEKAIELSFLNSTVCLLCHFQRPKIIEDELILEWDKKYVYLNELTFNYETFKVYYFDVEAEQKYLEEQLELIREENTKKYIETQKKNKIEHLIFQDSENKKYEINIAFKGEQRGLKLKEQEELDRGNASFYRILYSEGQLNVLKKLFTYPYFSFEKKLHNLFEFGYDVSLSDRLFLKEQFLFELSNNDTIKKESLGFCIALTVIYIKLKDSCYLLDLDSFHKYKHHLFGVLSVKLNKVVGFNYLYIRQIVNLYFNDKSRYYPFRHSIIKAIKTTYKGGLESFYTNEDRKGMLRKKIESFSLKEQNINKMYDYYIESIFPELVK